MNLRLDRRQFLVLSAAASGGALALALVPRALRAATAATSRRPDPWLTLDASGRATLTVPFSELGQGALLGITQLVAEELDLPLAAFTTGTAPMEARFLIKDEFYTGGSGSIRPLFDDWRRLGAAARSLLLAEAAARFGVPAASLATESGEVLHPNGHDRLRYGALTAAAAKRAPHGVAGLKPRSAWQVIGRSPSRPELRSLVEGSARFGIDQRLPGQWTATIAHAPRFGARVASVDPAPALGLPGVHAVVPLAAAVAVAGDTFWHAAAGLAALSIAWTEPPKPAPDSEHLTAMLTAALAGRGREVRPDTGPPAVSDRAAVEATLAGAHVRIEQTYSASPVAHATLEPQNTLAIVGRDGAELHTPTQHQSRVQTEVAAALGLPARRVAVHTTRIGGGYGRRLKADYAVEAALIARATGRPIKLVWSRSEDLQHDFYRPPAVARLTAALDAEGYPVALRARTAAANDSITGGMHGSWYRLGRVLVEATEIDAGLPVGAWRSVDAGLTAFFLESFIDELAERAAIDPLAYRLALAQPTPRLARVLEAAAACAGWADRRGRALGIAGFVGWNTYVAVVAEAARDARGRPCVRRISCAFDCGTAVNPGLVRAQVEGGITMAASAALNERITLAGGRVRERNFDDYPLLTMAAAPAIEVVLLDSPDAPVGGAGEPPLPAVAPAIANAFRQLTGSRFRQLPFAVG